MRKNYESYQQILSEHFAQFKYAYLVGIVFMIFGSL